MLAATLVMRWFAVVPLFMLVSGGAALGCAASQEKTTCGLDQAWKAYQRFRELSASPIPRDRPSIRDAAEVDVAAVACARQRNGTVLCWEGEESWPIPTLDDATSISVGTFGACAIRRTGSVVCWYHHEMAEHARTEQAVRDLDWEMTSKPPLVTVDLPAAAYGACVSRPELTAGDVAGYSLGAVWACAHTPAPGVLCWKIDESYRLEPDRRVDALHQHAWTPPLPNPAAPGDKACPPAWPTAKQEGASRSLKAYQLGAAAVEELALEQALRLFKIAQKSADFLELWAAAGTVYRLLGDPEQAQEIRERYVACGGDPRRFDDWRASPQQVAAAEPLEDLEAEPEECAFRERQGSPCDRPLPEGLHKTRFDSIAVSGDAHACAIDESGQVWCWGANDVGQLGDGTRQDRPVPVKVHGLSDTVSIGVGLERSCVVRRTGRVACWGVGAKPRSAWAAPTD